jgi:hypothetical protein
VARTSRRALGSGVDPQDEPSAEWGWHGSFPNGTRIAGIVSALVLVALVFGPYQSRLQDWWIAGIVLLLVVAVVRGTIKRRNAWRR